VGSMLAQRGFAVCEADDLAHREMAPGCAAFDEIVGRFGRQILGDDGRIDRVRLGRYVFADADELAALNAIVHPRVYEAVRVWLASQAGRAKAAAVIVPLLFETGRGDGWDAVICVAAPLSDQLRRLAGRGLGESEARLRVAAQMPLYGKVRKADYVLMNTGSREALARQLNRVIGTILET